MSRYKTLGGRENLCRALELYQKDLELFEASARELGTAESRRGLAVGYHKVGSVYGALGGRENLRRALELHKKTLELTEALARELNTVSAYEDLAVSYYMLGVHPAVGPEDRRNYLKQLLELSERLYQQTRSERHQNFIAVAKKSLGAATQETPPDARPARPSLWRRLFGHGKK